MRLLKKYGDGGQAVDMGYDLPFLTGWLESLASDESEGLRSSGKGPKWKRQELIDDAIQKLNEAIEM